MASMNSKNVRDFGFVCLFLGAGRVGKGSLTLQVTEHCGRKPRKEFKGVTETEDINECY